MQSIKKPNDALAKKSQSRKPIYKHKSLKEISTRTLRIILDSVKYQLRNKLFLSPNQIRGLEKRKRDLSMELDSRLEQDEYMCSMFPKEFEGIPQRKYWENGRLVENELVIAQEQDIDRKSRTKAYVNVGTGRKRLRPGKKVDARYRRRI